MSKKLKSLLSLGNNIYLLAIISHLLITFICYINIFPSGYIFSGADVVQFFNVDKTIHDFKYVWWNNPGEGVFLQYYSYILYYYLIHFITSILNLSLSGQSFAYFFIFLNGSFISFLLGLNLFSKEHPLSDPLKVGLSWVYTFNVYTLYNFYYTWGYSPFLFLYVLLPLIFSLTFRFFTESLAKEKWKYLFLIAIVGFLTNISNGNLSFFISLNIFLIVFIGWLYSFLKESLLQFFKKFILFYFVYFSSVCWSVLPQIVEMLRLSRIVSNGDYPFDFTYWVIWQAVKFNDLFHVIRVDFDRSLTIFNFGIVLFIILFSFLIITLKNKSAIRNIFFILLFLSLFLLNKGVGLFYPELINEVFSNPLLITLKSYDKVLVFVPYFLLMVIYFSLNESNKIHKYLLLILIAISLLTSYPLLIGQIQKKYSLVFDYKYKDYTTADYSYLHKLPDEYIKAAALLKTDISDTKILHTPYSVINSVGWVNYPKWKVVGADPLAQLFDKPSIHMNSFGSFGSWNYGKFWNAQSVEDSKWIVPFAGSMGVKYFIYHKDIAPRFYDNTYNKMVDFENKGFIKRILDNDYFSLYELNSDFIYPSVYIPTKVLVSNDLAVKMPKIFNNFSYRNEKISIIETPLPINVSSDASVIYKKVSPVSYDIIISNIKDLSVKIPLSFTESYHSGWSITSGNSLLAKLEDFLDTSTNIHTTSNFYNNLWFINISNICIKSPYNCITKSDGSTTVYLSIEFWPQYIFIFSLVFSISSIVISCFIYFLHLFKYVKR